jgi:hypothetical protein
MTQAIESSYPRKQWTRSLSARTRSWARQVLRSAHLRVMEQHQPSFGCERLDSMSAATSVFCGPPFPEMNDPPLADIISIFLVVFFSLK